MLETFTSMFLAAHVAAGLVIGKFTGNVPAALAGAVLVDLDHVVPYVRHGVFRSVRTFIQTVTDPKDPYGEQRNFLHNIGVAIVVCVLAVLIDRNFGIAFAVGYASHLLLDALDGSDYYPFYPLKRFNLRGPVRYFSKAEFFVTIGMLLIFFLL